MKVKWFIAVAVLLIIVFTGCMVFQNVNAIHDFFSPSMRVTMRSTDFSDEWQQLNVGKTGYLNFDNIFYQKAIILDGNCQKDASFRISDEQGNVIMSLTLSPGTECGLETLRKHTNYIVEIKTIDDFICVSFI